MAKVKFFLDNGANIHSRRDSGVLDTVEDLGYLDGEWELLSEDDRHAEANRWANEYIDIGYIEVE